METKSELATVAWLTRRIAHADPHHDVVRTDPWQVYGPIEAERRDRELVNQLIISTQGYGYRMPPKGFAGDGRAYLEAPRTTKRRQPRKSNPHAYNPATRPGMSLKPVPP